MLGRRAEDWLPAKERFYSESCQSMQKRIGLLDMIGITPVTLLPQPCLLGAFWSFLHVGALLAGFVHALPAESFAKIKGAIPGAADMIADAQPQGEAAHAASMQELPR
jgi:hypothetical protein